MKCKYRVRWFASKGASLVLLWTLLVFVVEFAQLRFDKDFNVITFSRRPFSFLVLVATPLSGWLADAKFGNYKVFRAGAVLLFISTVINCLFTILETTVWNGNQALQWIHVCLGFTSFIVGGCACIVTALPLGLDQMPDASSSQVSSYIAWFVCSIFIGEFFGEVLNLFRRGKYSIDCIDEDLESKLSLFWSLLLTFLMAILIISIFLLSPKWLIIEPKAPQSLRTIYHILKFAAKHKVALNRSALTYWEEDIPSRIDLGKSKYGGPFTTEQVEDVKTILRLILISIPFYILVSIALFHIVTSNEYAILSNLTFCPTEIKTLFVKNPSGYCIIGTSLHEFLVYPLISHKLPSILKRIGAVSLILTLISLICFSLNLTHYLSMSSEITTEWIVLILRNSSSGLLYPVLFTSVLEFTTAQSPYNMRGLLVSVLTVLICTFLGSNVSRYDENCTQPWYSLIPFSVKTVLYLIGFLLFCVVARWYKRRVRDEDYSTQRVVEEVYDRYLTAAAAQTRSYGT